MRQVVKLIVSFISVVMLTTTNAASVDTVSTPSASMHKYIKAVIIKPDTYNSKKTFPVVYLLHGYSDDYSDWITKAPIIAQLADRFQMLVVCPDGNFSSWYLNSPADTASKYETYISNELVKWIDKNYKTMASPKDRAITGLSMGGHGALYNAFRHQDVFGAAGSMSSGVDLRPFSNNWKLAKKLGTYANYPERWDANSVMNLTHLLTPNSLAIIIDCGTEDFFYGVNKQLHEKLLERNIPHDFTTRPGGHTWAYWSNAIGFQLQYFSNFFAKKQ